MMVLLLLLGSFARAQVPVTQSFQLQRLITQSELQLAELRKIVEQQKSDLAALQSASKILEKMTEGIDRSIEKYQGTRVYERALLELQSKDEFKKTFSDFEHTHQKKKLLHDDPTTDLHIQQTIQFQKDSVRANQTDFDQQNSLEKALTSAPPGFVPKIQAQAQLGEWRTSTRLSTQLTELLATVHAMREELRALRQSQKDAPSDPLSALVTGSEWQNKKQKERAP